MPTPFFGWTLPQRGQDPWYADFVDTWQQVDTTISSVELASTERMASIRDQLASRATVVISTNPGGSRGNMGGIDIITHYAGAWTVLSADPIGRYVGSFEIVGTKSSARFEVLLTGSVDSGGPEGQPGSTYNGLAWAFDTTWRLICQGTNVTSLDLPRAYVGWYWAHDFIGQDMAAPLMIETCSLGQGTYSVELQGTILQAGVGSSFCLGDEANVRVIMTEIRS